jgi:hypothetical protein
MELNKEEQDFIDAIPAEGAAILVGWYEIGKWLLHQIAARRGEPLMRACRVYPVSGLRDLDRLAGMQMRVLVYPGPFVPGANGMALDFAKACNARFTDMQRSSEVEHHVANVGVAGSIPAGRSNLERENDWSQHFQPLARTSSVQLPDLEARGKSDDR